MEPRNAEETWAFECQPGVTARVSSRRLRVERAAWHGAGAGLICILPAFVAYMARHSALLPAAAWAQLLVEMTSFSVFAGTVHSTAIALGLSLSSRGLFRVASAALLGALSGALVTAIGCAHFGSKAIPYLGGVTLYITVALGVLLFAVGHARSETASWRTAVRCTLLPVPLVLAFIALCALVAPGATQLDHATIRTFVNTSGLALTGALAGASAGWIVGAWIGIAILLTGRRRRLRTTRGSCQEQQPGSSPE